MKFLHASCVAIGNTGVILRGASGSGKSDLALRLINDGAMLVADDQVHLKSVSGKLIASPHNALAGKIEIRGCGIIDLPYRKTVAIGLVVDLEERDDIPRLPEVIACNFYGHSLPVYRLHGFDISCAIKIRTILNRLV